MCSPSFPRPWGGSSACQFAAPPVPAKRRLQSRRQPANQRSAPQVVFTLFPVSLLFADNFLWQAAAFVVRGKRQSSGNLPLNCAPGLTEPATLSTIAS